MPTYDFRCKACGFEFEKMNSISNRNKPELYPCPDCQEGPVERVEISSAPEVCPDAYNLGRRKVDGGFNEVLAKIHEQTPGSNLNQKLSRNPNPWT